LHARAELGRVIGVAVHHFNHRTFRP
jgi:hypothetical protein